MITHKVKIVGTAEIPQKESTFYAGILEQLVSGRALVLEFDNREACKCGQRCVHHVGEHKFGTGQIGTLSDGMRLYVWRLPKESPNGSKRKR